MRGFHLASAGLYLIVLSAAGPLRKDKAYRRLARDKPAPDPISIIPVPDDTDPSISITSSSTLLTITTSTSISEIASAPTQVPPPVNFRSTSYKNTTVTLKTSSLADGSSVLPFAVQGLTNSPVTGTQTTASAAESSVLVASTTTPTTTLATQNTNTQIPTFSFSNTTLSRVPNKTTKADGLPTSPSTTSSVLAPPKANSATPLASLSSTTAIPAPQNPKPAITQSTTKNTSSITLPTKTTTSTSTIAQTSTVQISATVPPTTTVEPTFTVTEIPSILPVTLQTATSISPAQYTANLNEARSYNTFFSTLNFSSTCTAGSIACLSGNMATCNQDGNFVISICETGSECFAMPMKSTAGVVVECTNKALASTVLGLVATSTTGGAVTIPATSIEITKPTPESVVTTTSSSTSLEPALITMTIVIPTLPTTTDIVTQTQVISQATKSIAPVPAAPQVTVPPEPQTTTSIFRGVSIIPVTNQNAVIEKETVTVTVTKTLRIPEASAI